MFKIFKTNILTISAMRLFFLFLFVFSFYFVYGQVNMDVRSFSLGKVQSLSGNLGNPSCLSFQDKKSIGLGVNNYFEIKELNTFWIYSLVPNKMLDIGINISDYCYQDYHLLTFKTGFSKKVNQRLSLGASLCFNKILTESDKNFRTEIRSDLGIIFKSNEQIQWALFVKDFVNNTSNDESMIYCGSSYKPVNTCSLLLELSSDFRNFSQLSAGFEYELKQYFFIRAGMITNPFTPTFGVGYTIENFTFDFGINKHQILGYSNALEISYHF